jgi:hypothetical protein
LRQLPQHLLKVKIIDEESFIGVIDHEVIPKEEVRELEHRAEAPSSHRNRIAGMYPLVAWI